MKAYLCRKPNIAAGAILVALIVCATASLAMASYILMLQQQNTLGARSQTWNASLSIVEAGIEEALEHLNANSRNLGADGWSFDGTTCSRERTLPDGNKYLVSIIVTNLDIPLVVSRAYVKPFSITHIGKNNFFATVGADGEETSMVTRAVLAKAGRGSPFLAAMIAKKGIELNGYAVQTDSFDSSDPSSSTNGQYDPTKARDKGDVATNEGISSAIDVRNVHIYGHAHIGPGAGTVLGPNGGIGSHAWQATHTGIQPDWVVQDSNFTLPDTALPYDSGLVPAGGTIGGTNYDHILSSSDYYANSLSGKTIVLGKSRLVLPNGLRMADADSLIIGPNGGIAVYSGGNSCIIQAEGVINQSAYAANFIVYCAPSVTSFALNGNTELSGVVVAPNADVRINGVENNTLDFVGCLMANSVTMNGLCHFHYDEAMANIIGNGRYLVTSWEEIP